MQREKGDNQFQSARVVGSSSECMNTYFHKGPLPVWLPVILSCTKIVFHIETKTRVGSTTEKIRKGNAKVRINRCRLLDFGKGHRGKIFFLGYVQEKIEYFDENVLDSDSTNIRFVSETIPFEWDCDIDFYLPPRLKQSYYHIHPVELVPGTYTEASNPSSDKKQGFSEALQCELMDMHMSEIVFMKGLVPDEVTGELTVTISFLLTQKQCIYLR